MRSFIGFLMTMAYVAGWISASYGFQYDKILLAFAFLISGILLAFFREELPGVMRMWSWYSEQVRKHGDDE